MKNFKDWMTAQESSAFTRLRRDAALGLKPPISGAAVNSRSTAHPFEVEKLGDKKKKKKKKKKEKCKNLDEKAEPVKDSKIDAFLGSIGQLKKDVDVASDVIDKESKKPKKPKENELKDEKPEEEEEEKDEKKKGKFAGYAKGRDKEELKPKEVLKKLDKKE